MIFAALESKEWLAIYISLFGFWITGLGFYNLFEAFASKFWRTTKAVVRQSSLSKEAGEVANHRYWFHLTYTFEVNGQEYRGHRLRLKPLWNTTSQKYMESIQERYRKGSTIDIFYNPKKPKHSVVEPGGGISLLVLPAMGIVFLLGAISCAGRLSWLGLG